MVNAGRWGWAVSRMWDCRRHATRPLSTETVVVKEYVYLVPFIESEDEVFLKTVIPSRKATKTYRGGNK
jgi:hypothetical protein